MSLSNATENQILKCLLQGTDPSYRAGATLYVALVTDAGGGVNVSESSPVANECTYDGYARVPLTKASAWTDNGSSFTNSGTITFGKRTDAGATQVATAFVICDTLSGAISLGIIGDLTTDLSISQNIQPQFEASQLTITCE
jgi:hypothetical protein